MLPMIEGLLLTCGEGELLGWGLYLSDGVHQFIVHLIDMLLGCELGQ